MLEPRGKMGNFTKLIHNIFSCHVIKRKKTTKVIMTLILESNMETVCLIRSLIRNGTFNMMKTPQIFCQNNKFHLETPSEDYNGSPPNWQPPDEPAIEYNWESDEENVQIEFGIHPSPEDVSLKRDDVESSPPPSGSDDEERIPTQESTRIGDSTLYNEPVNQETHF